MKNFLTFLCLTVVIGSCCTSKNSPSNQYKQGITGFIKEITGNQMPAAGKPAIEAKPISTTVYVYEATNLSQVERMGTSPFYNSINTKFIKSVQSDEKGKFMVKLPVGNYSLFTKVDGKFYANQFDTKNNIALTVVEANKFSEVNIIISDKASF